MNNPVNLVDPSGQNPLLILAAVSFLAGVGVNTWMQYQANHGWCGFDPLAALEWGISAAFMSTLVALTAIEALALLGMGLQGIGVLINWLPAFSAGSSLSATAGAAAVWFMTGQKPWSPPPTPRAPAALPAKTIKIGPKELQSYPSNVPKPSPGNYIWDPSGSKTPTSVLRANYLAANPGATIPPGSHMHHIKLEAFRNSSSLGGNLVPLLQQAPIGGYGTGSVHAWWWSQGIGSWTPIGTQIIIGE